MMAGYARRGGVAALALAWLATGGNAEPRKLGLDDLGPFEKPFWSQVDIVSNYAAFLHLCRRDVDVERGFRDVAGPCVDAASLDKAATTFRARYRAILAHADPHACQDPGVLQRGLPDKLTEQLTLRMTQVGELCQAYLKTGTYGTR